MRGLYAQAVLPICGLALCESCARRRLIASASVLLIVAGGVPAEEALPRALEDLDCAPDVALPHILDVLLAAAPYDAVLRAVRAAAVRATSTASDSEAAAAEAPDAAAAAAAAATEVTAGDALSGLRLLQRVQSAVVAALRGARRVAPDLALRAPQLACHTALMLAGCAAADTATAAVTAAGRQKRQQQQPRAQQQQQQPKDQELMAAASKLAAATTATVIPQLLQYGGSRVALSTATHVCTALLQPHPELRGALLLPLLHMLAFSNWAPHVDAKGLLSRKFEPHPALPARAAVCAWLQRLGAETCESLGCEALVLPSRAVVNSEAFKRQAVTSERWLPLLEVGPRDLVAYLAEMRGAGYSLVGVEQAAGSVGLDAFPFPARCVLLLGNEQSGVPQGLIAMLDACVEIPMLGVTRSLNAHVSGAMAVWQYVQQQQRLPEHQ